MGEELKGIQLTAELLAQNIKAHHEKGTSYHVGMLGEKMKRIEDKCNSLIMFINSYILIPGGVFSIGSLWRDVISPEKLQAFDFTLNQNIDWGDIGSRGVKYAAVFGALYAVARCGALVLKWKREAEVAETVTKSFKEHLQKRLKGKVPQDEL